MMANSLLKPDLLRAACCTWKMVEKLGCSYHLHCHHQRPCNAMCPRQRQTYLEYNYVTVSRTCHSNQHRLIPQVAVCSLPWKMPSSLHGNSPSILPHPARNWSSFQHSSPAAVNPVLKLQQFVPQPILDDRELIFTPSEAELTRASQLFVPSASHRIQFVKGTYYPEEAPVYKLPEIAFIGRSNVGKSSLIRELFAAVDGLKVRTSHTPGHTKLLLFFRAGKTFSLVDMPGYGYRQPANFITSAEGFLKTRKNLRNTFLLIDSSVGLQKWDYVAIEMLEEFSIPYLVVLTKSDKASKRQLIESIMTVTKVIREHTQGCLPQPFLVSSKSGEGLPFLKGFIAYTTGNLQLQNS